MLKCNLLKATHVVRLNQGFTPNISSTCDSTTIRYSLPNNVR